MRWLAALGLVMLAMHSVGEEIGVTVFARGDVSAVDGEQVRVLSRRDAIFKDDKINTGTDARAVLKLSDDTVVTLGEHATFYLEEYVFNDREKRAIFDIPVGAFRIVTGKLTKSDDHIFTVKTPRSNIAVRGTDFWGGSLHEGAIDIALLEGEHALIVSNEFGTVVITTPGYGTTIYDGKAPSEPALWSADMVQKAVATISY